jgi:FK506-binding protein 2
MRLSTIISAFVLVLTAAPAGVLAAELGIKTTLEVENCKRKTAKDDVVHMHYRGTLASDGSQFDASYDRGNPLVFRLGAGKVIKGWVNRVIILLLDPLSAVIAFSFGQL